LTNGTQSSRIFSELVGCQSSKASANTVVVRLPEDLLTGRYAVTIFAHHLEVIVAVADGSECRVDQERHENPDIRCGPKNGAEQDAGENQEAAHGGRVLLVETLREVAGAVVVVMLAELRAAEVGGSATVR